MIPRCPEIALGLQALTVALKAKCGLATRRDAEALRETVAAFAPDDAAWSTAAARFGAEIEVDQAVAGRRLHDWIAGPGAVVLAAEEVGLSTARAGGVLAAIAAEPGWRDMSWTERRDING